MSILIYLIVFHIFILPYHHRCTNISLTKYNSSFYWMPACPSTIMSASIQIDLFSQCKLTYLFLLAPPPFLLHITSFPFSKVFLLQNNYLLQQAINPFFSKASVSITACQSLPCYPLNQNCNFPTVTHKRKPTLIDIPLFSFPLCLPALDLLKPYCHS